jgi:hypothetical protein
MRRAVAYLDVDFVPEGVTVVGTERADVAGALERIATAEADTLIVTALHSAARTLPELLSLIGWLDEADASLIAVDVRLDTTTQQGRRMVALLREVESWDRRRETPRGRPGLAHTAPHVAERIAELRARGFGLKAIAATLNAEGIPTPRGGAEWRASSVQSALGYRRPKPPPPGAPRPPKPPSGPGHGRGPGHGPAPKHRRHPKP